MHTQRDLFDSCRAELHARQDDLFQAHEYMGTALRCVDCGEYLEETGSGYLACPLGHGRLLTQEPHPASRHGFDCPIRRRQE